MTEGNIYSANKRFVTLCRHTVGTSNLEQWFSHCGLQVLRISKNKDFVNNF